ncbi:MAG: ATP-binding cassette domain-containing protein [Campylobacteraceae bacterium]|jgi:phospholipid/cholesterol/gamma-HCH transport system ATP-binding protein|nr:ATP-binding cassette domain-containing protein [Campylobacteraceae bacterium]
MNVIEARNIVTAFGDRVIHDSISFDVKEGEVFTVIGSSGSGKSTLLKELIMLLRPQSGSIKIFGSDILGFDNDKLKNFSREWGVLFQSSALFSSLTIKENIAILLKEHAGISGALADELVSYKLSLVGLPGHVRHMYPSELSGGMKKRAALARALALEPSLLFLDEPTSGLDPISSRGFDDLILSLRDALALTVVLISHDVHSVTDISSKIMALHDKKVVFLGSVEEAKRCDHKFLKSFFDVKGEQLGK